MNSTLVEDITWYHRVTTMYDKLLPSTHRIEMLLENAWNESVVSENITSATGAAAKDPTGFRHVVHGLAAGLFNSNERMIWLKVAPIQIELELVGDASVAAESVAGDATNGNVVSWVIEDVRLLADVVYCTSEFVDNFSRSLLKSIPLPIAITTYAVQKIGFSMMGTSFTVNVNRALTRLKSIWWTMESTGDNITNQAQANNRGPFVLQSNAAIAIANGDRKYKEANMFYHPMQGSTDPTKDTLEWRIQIGGRYFPTLPVRGIRESAWFLHKALGMSYRGMCDLPIRDYSFVSFVGAYSFEKAINCIGEGASYSGESTIQGQQISLIVTNIPVTKDGAGLITNGPVSVTVVLAHDEIINLRQEGCEVLV
jgi:hypothetical protein